MSVALSPGVARWQDAGGRRWGTAGREAAVADAPSDPAPTDPVPTDAVPPEAVPPDAVPPDAVLLARGGSAAQAAFAEVVRRHGGPLYAVAYRQLESAADAEEIVQDAFLLLWRKRGGVRLAGDSALPWLIVAVKHLAANRRRARIRRSAREAEARPPQPIAPDEQGAVADLLRRAFAALPPLDAQVARLCLAEDVSYADAAARLGLTEGAVRNRLSRARARLRKDLEADR